MSFSRDTRVLGRCGGFCGVPHKAKRQCMNEGPSHSASGAME